MATKSADPVDEERKRLIGRRLVEARESRGLTQMQVADAVGVARDTISRWERGSHQPARYYWPKLRDLFGVSYADLGFVDAATVDERGVPPPAPVQEGESSQELAPPAPAGAQEDGQTGTHRPISRARAILLLLLLLCGSLMLASSTALPSHLALIPAPGGTLTFHSSGQGESAANEGMMDMLTLTLTDPGSPAPGTGYYAWMAGKRVTAETRWQPLGWLVFSQESATLLYRDPQRRNLLATFSRFLVTQEQAGIPPLQPSATWIALASISTVPTPRDPHHYSLFNHLQHLLAADPALERLHLAGGLATYLAANTEAVQQEAAALVPDWRAGRLVEVHTRLIRILDWLDGSDAVSADVPTGTPFLALLPAARVGLLTLSPTENPPGYILHTDLHLEGVAAAPGASVMQQSEALRLRDEMNAIALALAQVRAAALPLLRLPDASLASPAALHSLTALATSADAAWSGTPAIPGARAIAAAIATLAVVTFQPV